MKNFISFAIVSALTLWGFEASALKSWEKPYPCIEKFECDKAGEFDEGISEVSVTYYDDLGQQMKWTHQVHSMENMTNCEAAMNESFPYNFFKKCEVKGE